MKILSYKYQVGTSYNFAAFIGNIFRLKTTESFELSFERLGGEYLPEKPEGFKDNVSVWKFPAFVTSQVIEEVIRNTCFECGGMMKDGIVMNNGELRIPTGEFSRGNYTPYKEGPATIKQCRKCISCGHSHIENQLLPINPHV
jgi:hypothetical protein